ncbi:MAG: NADH-quinone oxidoreductase subunit L [Myxococcota bacterium]
MTSDLWPIVAASAAALVPIVFLVAGGAAPTLRDPFRIIPAVTGTAMAAALVVAGATALSAPAVIGPALRVDPVTAIVLTLVAFIGLVILRYSRSYLEGDPGQRRYLRWLLLTLAAVTTLIVTDHLAVLAVAWTAASLFLHQLLTHFTDRAAAQVTAHKKFIASRLADLSLLGALGLVWSELGTLSISGIEAAVTDGAPLTPALGVATVLVVLCVALKSAQLPFHGWLAQVMEAPTPVSALLHAGVVNIGGLVLIRLAPLMSTSAVAQTLLVAIGTFTAVVAALVMSTRSAVKGKLAWSTMAQMGFMLVQCGLGAYGLALLHLVAHSLYKAHAFLSSGSVVERWQAYTLTPGSRVGPVGWTVATVTAFGLVAFVSWNLAIQTDAQPELVALGLVLAYAVTPVLAHGAARGAGVAAVGLTMATAGLYFGWHTAFDALAPHVAPPAGLALRLDIVVIGFTAGFAAQAALQSWPHGALANALRPHLVGGLYLDELLTRFTFWLWPPELTSRHDGPRSLLPAPAKES